MKTLYVLRHGHAAPETETGSDHARGLTLRGKGEVRRSAQFVNERTTVPSLVLSSSATRARQSAQLCLGTWPGAVGLRIVDDLYLAGPATYLAALVGAEPHAKVMVVGHNPGLESLVFLLTERSEHLPTAALVEIELPIETWADLATLVGGLAQVVHVFRG